MPREIPAEARSAMALMAAACFLIAAVSAFRIDVRQQIPTLESGNGGFSLAAESDQPIYQNLNTPQGRAELGFTAEDEKQLAGTTAFALRVKPGDDASCLNLYRPRQPRLLGRAASDLSTAAVLPGPPPRQNAKIPGRCCNQNLGQDPDGVARRAGDFGKKHG